MLENGADSCFKVIPKASPAGMVSKVLDRNVNGVQARKFAGGVCRKLNELISNLNFAKSL